ncbi:uncharacterized protein LOC114278455 [Camellia sinensis]|uniref:uncharacterized protein LOC114278455 n=1 Tax=Camellia sinensis TaxID=4442 RepID=UPI001035E5AD|nr:uncharacterized protein LOC114278455 [Camellia sinensis]
MDMIGKIYPHSSKQHRFILVATNYFIKWVEAKPCKTVDQTEVTDFIKELIYRFGIPQTITADNRTVFDGKLVKLFAAKYELALLTPPHIMHKQMVRVKLKVVRQRSVVLLALKLQNECGKQTLCLLRAPSMQPQPFGRC